MNKNENSVIPIKNIYYMLCYAWNTLTQADEKLTGAEPFDNIYDLLAKVMISGLHNLLKRGFYREYQVCTEELSLIRGKIDVGHSVKNRTDKRKKLICQYDEFTYNVPFNQILKAVVSILIKYPKLNNTLKKELIRIRVYFASIDEIKPTQHTFSLLRYNRNNMHYKMLMNICELVCHSLITNECGNTVRFSEFIRDQQMAVLYEKFVLNFYKYHSTPDKFKVHSPKILWETDGEYNHVGLQYLPEMRTDIVIENCLDNTQLIIDTKFYSSVFGKGNYSDTKKLISGNLYQIYTYVTNSEFVGNVSGMLLYPTTNDELNCDYRIGGHVIKVNTLNLASDWNEICQSLKNFANIQDESID
jgi:5-methylcytosine-specific restriction enzyme subunit McrC